MDDSQPLPPLSRDSAKLDPKKYLELRDRAQDKVEITALGDENTINILAWNVESDGNNPQVIANQLKGMEGFEIFALSEVRGRRSARIYSEAIREIWGDVQEVVGKTGREDALAIIFNPAVFDLVKVDELNDLNPDMKYRSPLAVTLKHKATDQVLIVMNNHLARGNADNRRIQAAGLREWARKQTLPIVAVGDYNFDYVFETEKGNREFVEFMRDGIWKWVKPDPLVDSNYFDGNEDRVDDFPGSILDFAFVAQQAKDWKTICKVHQWPGDFPDDEFTSDHRPVEICVNFR